MSTQLHIISRKSMSTRARGLTGPAPVSRKYECNQHGRILEACPTSEHVHPKAVLVPAARLAVG